MKPKYYLFDNTYRGKRYFKVYKGKKAIQVVVKSNVRGTQIMGISELKYISFLGSWGWRLAESRNIKQISKHEFEKAFNKTLKRLSK